MPGTSLSGFKEHRHAIAACLLLALEPALSIVGPLIGVIIFGGWAPLWTYVTAQAVNSLLVAFLASRIVHGLGGGMYKAQPLHLLSGVMCTVLFYPLAMLLAELVGRVSPNDAVSETVMGSVAMGPALAWITMAFLPAVSEELLFRGALFGSLRRYGAVSAIAASSALFSLFHGNLQQMGYTLLMGAVWACLREFSGSVLPGMLGHMAFNSVALMAAFHPAGAGAAQELSLMPLAALAAFMGTGGGLILSTMRGRHRSLTDGDGEMPEPFKAAPFLMVLGAAAANFGLGLALASI